MKTVCIYHGIDLDGWMSAAIVKHWYEKKHYPNTLYHGNVIVDPNEEKDSLTFLGWNYGDDIPDLSEYDKVIMCDVSFPLFKMNELKERLKENFIWIDHHISAIKESQHTSDVPHGIRDTKFAACELTWKYFFPNEEMPEIVRLLGRYDCFGHKGTDEEETVLEFQYGARQVITNYEDAYRWLNITINENMSLSQKILATDSDGLRSILNSGYSIYQYLCTDAKQAYKNGFTISMMEPEPTSVKKPVIRFICFNKERFNPINFGIDYHKDGYDGAACFSYNGNQWMFSLYNDNGEVDCSQIAKQFGGGGHKGAAGFVTKDLEGFLLHHKI